MKLSHRQKIVATTVLMDLVGIAMLALVEGSVQLRQWFANGYSGQVAEKPADTLRIAFVGASTTFSAEVSSNDMTWPHLVTEAIQGQYPDVSIDYVNAAVPGYTVKSSLINFRRRVAPLHPDISL